MKKFGAIIAASAVALSMASPVSAQKVTGAVDLSYFSSDRDSSDTDIVDSPFGGISIGGFATTTFSNGLRLTGDLRYNKIDDDGLNDVYESGPEQSGALGVHVGKEFGKLYAGGYVAYGRFDGYEKDSGHTYGIETEYAVASNVDLFAQLGRVKANGDKGDNEFEGLNYRVGVSTMLMEKLGMTFAYEYAKSDDCFEDCGDQWGKYTAVALDLSYKLNKKFDLLASFENQDITANTEDVASVGNISFGVRYSFGGASRNNLATPIGGFKAAGWAEPLD